MRFWRVAIQIIGFATIGLSLAGFGWLVHGLQQQFAHPLLMPEAPAFRTVFLVMGLVDCVFLFSMCVAAIGLLRVKRSAVKFYTWVYIILVFYVFAPGAFWGSGPIGRSIAAASGIGDLGLAPLIFIPIPFLYAIVSVALANLAIRKLPAMPH